MRFLPIPSPILFSGKDASLELCDAIVHRGCKKMLLVTDEILMQLKLGSKIIQRLEDQGISVTVYSGVLPDPTTDQVKEGVKLARENGCDAVIAFGGGSSIDAAKTIAACVTNSKNAKQLEGFFKVKQPPLPLYVVPTTAGTGSEATIAAVISDSVSHKKSLIIDLKLVPKMAALDGNLMLGLPPAVTAATGMDALTHAIEAYISANATDETDQLALASAKLIFNNVEQAVSQGSDFHVRQNMAMGSFYAGLAINKAGLGYVHAIAHNIGAAYGTPHGVANAIILPRILDYSLENIEERLANMARACGLADGNTGDRDAACVLIDKIRNMMASFGIDCYFDKLKPADIPQLAKAALKEAHFTPYAVPKYMDQQQCEKLIRDMMVS